MSHPPKGTILAPRARWAASRGEVRSVTSANLSGGGDRLSGIELGVEGPEVEDAGVDLLDHPVEGEEVQHALAAVLVHHVDELVVAHEDHRLARDHQLHGAEVVAEVAEVLEGGAHPLELLPESSSVLIIFSSTRSRYE